LNYLNDRTDCMKPVIVAAATILLHISAPATTAAAQSPAPATTERGITVAQRIADHHIPFEDTVEFEISLSWPGPQSAYLFDRPLNLELDHLKIGRFSSTISSTGQGEHEITTKTYHYRLLPLAPGTAEIEPVAISYLAMPDSIRGSLTTEKMTVEIDRPIPPPEPGDLSSLTYFGIALAALLAGAVIILARRGRSEPKLGPRLTPRQVFLQQLGILRADSENDLKRFQGGLYKLLCAFLFAEYDIEVGDKEREQLDQELADNSSLGDGQRDTLMTWLLQARQDKFRPVPASPGETIRRENAIRAFFERLQDNKQ
jgi:hypothetical protein